RRRVPPARSLGCLWLVLRPCDSPFVPFGRRESLLGRRSGAYVEYFTVRLFFAEGKRGRYGVDRASAPFHPKSLRSAARYALVKSAAWVPPAMSISSSIHGLAPSRRFSTQFRVAWRLCGLLAVPLT